MAGVRARVERGAVRYLAVWFCNSQDDDGSVRAMSACGGGCFGVLSAWRAGLIKGFRRDASTNNAVGGRRAPHSRLSR